MTTRTQPHTNALTRREGDALAPQQETATAHAKALAESEVQAKYLVAIQRPRDLDVVRERMLKDCRRPRFAQVARYHLPIGDGVEGWSIRFVEAAMRAMGNLASAVLTLFDDETRRIIRITVTDYESNVSHSSEATVEKTVERRSLRKGQKPLAMRANSYGDTLYVVPATEGDFRSKLQSEVSKAVRTNGLRHVPGWLLDEALDELEKTAHQRDAADPDAAQKKIADAFAGIGVKVAELKRYLGHDLSSASPAELAHLRAVYATVAEGAFSWADCLASRTNDVPDEDGSDPHAALKAKLADRLKAKPKKKRATKKAAPKSDPKVVDEPDAKAPTHTDDELEAMGWERDANGEWIPPSGWEG
jgi:hypothetical protein